MALVNDIRQLFQAHIHRPEAPVSVKKHIWSQGWTSEGDPATVAQDVMTKFEPCYTDLAVFHLPTVFDSSTDAGKQSIIAATGLTDPAGPSQYFFYGLVLEGVRAKQNPDQECLYDSEL